MEEAETFIEQACKADPRTDSFPFAIEHDDTLIGGVEIQKPGDLKEFPELPTIGYWLSEAMQGHGYMLEACVAALHWGFARDACDTFAARVFAANYPSQKLLKKLGFELRAFAPGTPNLCNKTLRISSCICRGIGLRHCMVMRIL